MKVCSACGSAHCLRMGFAVCMHTGKPRQAIEQPQPVIDQEKAPAEPARKGGRR